MVVEGCKKMLLVVGVQEPSNGVVAEKGESLVVGSKKCLQARSIKKRGNSR